MFTGFPVARGSDEQVGLAAEERGDLEHIHHFGGRGALLRQMNVGQERQARRTPNAFERGEAFVEPGAACGTGA